MKGLTSWMGVSAVLLGILMCTLPSCAGRVANPILVKQVNDEYMGCEQIYQEMKNNDTEILNRIPKTQKKAENITYGIAGVFLLAPWLFMDLSTAEKKEIIAYQDRNEHLRHMAKSRNCRMSLLPKPITTPFSSAITVSPRTTRL